MVHGLSPRGRLRAHRRFTALAWVLMAIRNIACCSTLHALLPLMTHDQVGMPAYGCAAGHCKQEEVGHLMHITEGIVTGVPAAVSTGLALALTGIGAGKMRAFVQEHPRYKPLLGMAGAFIFLLSLIPIPTFNGFTCSHPCGTPLAGILLGPWISIALTALSLLLQAAFFNHGGFSTWGANLLALGVGGAVTGWLVFQLARRLRACVWFAAGVAGLLGDVVTYLISGAVLAGVLSHSPHPQYSFHGYLRFIYLVSYLPVQGPIAIGEMLLTGYSLHYIFQQRPELLTTLCVTKNRQSAPVTPVRQGVLLVLGLVLAMFLLTGTPAHGQSTGTAINTTVMPAPQRFTGMDQSVNERLAREAGRPPREPYLNTEKMGDLWNALLLLAGGVCGFVIGRWWHLLFGRKTDDAVTLAATEVKDE